MYYFQIMKCFLIQIGSIDADGVANTVVHVDVARTLIELKSDVKSLIEMVFNLKTRNYSTGQFRPKSRKSALR